MSDASRADRTGIGQTALGWAEVIGDPIDHSKSPLIHGFWLDALGLAGRYERTRVAAADLPAFLDARRGAGGWRGCNVTVPHKERVIPLLDRLDARAARIGAVNTVVRDGDALVGHNTDAAGFLDPLRDELTRPHGVRRALVLGSGGAARAIVAALAEHRFTIILAARDTGKAARLLATLPPGVHRAVPLDAFADPGAAPPRIGPDDLDLVVNATLLGMAGQPPLGFDIGHVPAGGIVYDIVYAPIETRLLRAARAAGLHTIDGLEMLVGQAAAAFRLLFGAAPPRDRDGALRAALLA